MKHKRNINTKKSLSHPHKSDTWNKVRNYGEFDSWMDYEKKQLHQVQPIIKNKPN